MTKRASRPVAPHDPSRRRMLGATVAATAVAGLTTGAARANLPAGTAKRGYADGPFGLVHYYDNGARGLPLLMFHQAPQSARQFDRVYEPDGQHLAEAFAARWRLYGPGADPTLITRYTVERFQGFGPFWQGHYAAFKYDHEPGLRKLTVRTLLLTNTGDQIYPHAQVARKIRPDFDYVELEGGGVDIVDQKPEEWAEAVARFLGAKPASA